MIDAKLYAGQRVRKGSRYEKRREGRSHSLLYGGPEEIKLSILLLGD